MEDETGRPDAHQEAKQEETAAATATATDNAMNDIPGQLLMSAEDAKILASILALPSEEDGDGDGDAHKIGVGVIVGSTPASTNKNVNDVESQALRRPPTARPSRSLEPTISATSLGRGHTRRENECVSPGAVNIAGVPNVSTVNNGARASRGHPRPTDSEQQDPPGPTLFSATLVPEEDPMPAMPLVEAKPALEGFQALIHNKRFKWLLVGLVLAIVVVVVPIAVMVPKKIMDNANNNANSTVVVVQVVNRTTILECGTESTGQANYRGTISHTTGGLYECQRWDSQLPNPHIFEPERYPEAGLEGNNHCRNPNGAPKAWCFAANATWAIGRLPCDVPFCDQELVQDQGTCGTMIPWKQSDYRGEVNVTRTGKTCQKWDSQIPQAHSRTDEAYPESGLVDNFCRNPDDERLAWCYTTNTSIRWEYCDVPFCEHKDAAGDDHNRTGEVETHTATSQCFNCTNLECGSPGIAQTDYRGFINTTGSGRSCLPWDNITVFDWPNDDILTDSNYCRNPGSMPGFDNGVRGAVCYTSNDPSSDSWEYCTEVPDCINYNVQQCGNYDFFQNDYKGNISVTKSGHMCQRWDTQFPQVHIVDVPVLMPEANLFDNFCRNPDGDKGGAWCYTTEEGVRWEHCQVPYCFQEKREQSLECGTRNEKQGDYRGTLSVTKSGRKCQYWSDQAPHGHSDTPVNRAYSGLQENYCRNPSGEGGAAWCYTVDLLVRKEDCAVPMCFEGE